MDAEAGIRRIRRGRGFEYRAAGGTRIVDEIELSRLRALAVPPMWQDVRISPDADADLQATGVDAAGRTQYLYHEAWIRQTAAEKFDRMLELAAALPALRRSVTVDLRAEGLARRTVLAAGIRMLDTAFLRIGSEQYAQQHGSIGLTTLRCAHVHREGPLVVLRFRGKGGVPWESRVEDPDLADVVSRLRRRGPRARLLSWSEGGRRRSARPADVNDDLRARAGGEFTAKDFRTIHGTAVAAAELARIGPQAGSADRTRAIPAAVKATAAALGNTPAVARTSYVDPRLFERYEQGRTVVLDGRSVEAQLIALLPAG